MKKIISSCWVGVVCFSGLTGCAADEPAAVPAAEAVEVPAPEIVTAAQWGSDPDPLPDDRKHIPRFVTIHHAGVTWEAGGDAAQKVRAMQAWGKTDKGWPDLPYHYLIAPDGTIFEGRPTGYEPETNTKYDIHGHLGVQVWGNFEEQRVSPAQVRSLVHVTAWLLQEHNLDADTIGGHLDRKNADTSCPGKDLYRYLEDGSFVAWVEATRLGHEPDIDLGPPLDGGPTEMIPDTE